MAILWPKIIVLTHLNKYFHFPAFCFSEFLDRSRHRFIILWQAWMFEDWDKLITKRTLTARDLYHCIIVHGSSSRFFDVQNPADPPDLYLPRWACSNWKPLKAFLLLEQGVPGRLNGKKNIGESPYKVIIELLIPYNFYAFFFLKSAAFPTLRFHVQTPFGETMFQHVSTYMVQWVLFVAPLRSPHSDL